VTAPLPARKPRTLSACAMICARARGNNND
jgi:hypothetical protein